MRLLYAAGLLALAAVAGGQEESSQTISGPKHDTAHYALAVFSQGHFALKVGGLWMPGCVCLNVNGTPQYQASALSYLACQATRTGDQRTITITGRLTPGLAFTEVLVCRDREVALTYTVRALTDLPRALVEVTAGPQLDPKLGLQCAIETGHGQQTLSFPPAAATNLDGVRSITWLNIGQHNARTAFDAPAGAALRLTSDGALYRSLVHPATAMKAGETASVGWRFTAEPLGDAALRAPELRARLGRVEYQVTGRSGLVHNLRTDRGLLVQYFSLNEQDTHQVSVGHGPSAWGGVTVKRQEAGQAYDSVAQGTIVNDWAETVTGRAATATRDDVHLTARRALTKGSPRLRLLMYVAQRLEEERTPFSIHTPDGRVIDRADDGQPLWFGVPAKATEAGLGPYRTLGRFPAGTEIVAPLLSRAELLRIRLGQAAEVAAFRFEIFFRGLWFQATEPNATDVDVTASVERLPERQVGPLTVVTQPASQALALTAGGIPLCDELTGPAGSAWQWHPEPTGASARLDLPAGGVLRWRVPLQCHGLEVRGPQSLTGWRLGSTRPAATLPPASVVEFAPTAGERVSLSPAGAATLQLSRDADGVAHLTLTATAAGTLRLQYQRLASVPADPVARREPSPDAREADPWPLTGLSCRRDATGDVIVSTPWWEVIHDAHRGGAIRSVRFTSGTGRNVLTAPVATRLVADREYTDTSESQPTITVVKDEPELVQLRVTGRLTAADGQRLARFDHLYEYRPMLVRRTCRYDLGAQPVACRGLAVGSLHLTPSLDEGAARRATDRTTWFHAVFPGAPVFEERSFSQYLSLYQRGVEGLDWLPTGDLAPWQNFATGQAGSARYAVQGDAAGNPELAIEPYALGAPPVNLSGSLKFESYLSLPQVRRCVNRRNFVVCLDTGDCSDDVLHRLADYGATDILLGCANTPGTFELGDLTAVKAVVAKAKRLGLKVYPFDPFQLVHRSAPIWKAHHDDWARCELKKGQAEPIVYSSYGDYFCPTADGFRQALREGYTKLVEAAGFDGLYHDFAHPYTCASTRHAPAPHLNTDGVLDALLWDRRFLGRDRVFCGHTGWVPVLFCQDLCTVTAVYEEYPATEPLPLYLTPAMGEGVSAAPRTLVSSFLTYGPNAPGEDSHGAPAELVDQYLSRCALVGISPWAHGGMLGATDRSELLAKLQPWLRLFALRGSADLGTMQFLPYHRQTAVTTDNPFVRAATYWNRDRAVVVLANSESAAPQSFAVKLHPAAFGWPADARLTLAPSRDSAALTPAAGGWRGQLPGWQWTAQSIERL